MLAKPTREEWDYAIADGFTSNGATFSPDELFEISIANGDETYPPLPADLHDYRYWCGGDLDDKCKADDEFLQGLYDCVSHLPELKREAARRRCRLYYEAVDELGESAWDFREEPRYGRGVEA
jgi:hypothetical protein